MLWNSAAWPSMLLRFSARWYSSSRCSSASHCCCFVCRLCSASRSCAASRAASSRAIALPTGRSSAAAPAASAAAARKRCPGVGVGVPPPLPRLAFWRAALLAVGAISPPLERFVGLSSRGPPPAPGVGDGECCRASRAAASAGLVGPSPASAAAAAAAAAAALCLRNGVVSRTWSSDALLRTNSISWVSSAIFALNPRPPRATGSWIGSSRFRPLALGTRGAPPDGDGPRPGPPANSLNAMSSKVSPLPAAPPIAPSPGR
mmetsp:Transcript_22195/g.75370  ORF Transcript_22195/g.75370 Transcript_22195/m.75370 type:complete len:261 (+) Transcript_22195:494-1276(+)